LLLWCTSLRSVAALALAAGSLRHPDGPQLLGSLGVLARFDFVEATLRSGRVFAEPEDVGVPLTPISVFSASSSLWATFSPAIAPQQPSESHQEAAALARGLGQPSRPAGAGQGPAAGSGGGGGGGTSGGSHGRASQQEPWSADHRGSSGPEAAATSSWSPFGSYGNDPLAGIHRPEQRRQSLPDAPHHQKHVRTGLFQPTAEVETVMGGPMPMSNASASHAPRIWITQELKKVRALPEAMAHNPSALKQHWDGRWRRL
jgi:hypothetical protein